MGEEPSEPAPTRTVTEPEDGSIRSRASRWLAAKDDPAGLLYGAIVSAAVVSTSGEHSDKSLDVLLITTSVLVIYWFAHVYIYAVSSQLQGDPRGLAHRLGSSFVHESSVMFGGIPAIVAFMAAALLGASTLTASNVALYVTIAVLLAVGYLSARRVGMTGWRLFAETAGAGVVGVLIVVLKSLLH